MSIKYNELFKEILLAYDQGKLEDKVNEILSDRDTDKNRLANIISSLCGVDLKYTENFSKDLTEALKTYKVSNRAVSKIDECKGCSLIEGKTICQNACPFDAIVLNGKNKNSSINKDKCIECGLCIEACPEENIISNVQFLPIFNLIKSNKTVVAAVAPSIEGQFGKKASLSKLRCAFKKIGFSDMVEVAFFADMLTLREAVEFNELVEAEDDFMLSSCCCPIWFGMLKKIYSDLVPHLSPSVSPMIAAGRVLKKLNPECKVVFIGPCIAKKGEIKNPDVEGAVDFVLTFQELKDIFDAFNINVEELPEDHSLEYASREGRLYGRTGGVSISVNEAVTRLFPDKAKLFTSTQANGIIECKKLLESTIEGKVDARFIEGMGCIGGCVGGPKAIISKEEGRERLNSLAESSKIKISLDSDVMYTILKKLGINSTADFKGEKAEIFERKL